MYLNKPFPRASVNSRHIILISGLGIACFMLAFQPFGTSSLNTPYKLIKLSGYGIISALVLAINLLLIKPNLKSFFNSWTIGKQIIWVAWIIFTIGIGNYLYSIFAFNFDPSPIGFVLIQVYSFLLGIIPAVIIILIIHNISLKNNLKKSKELNGLLKEKENPAPPQNYITLRSYNQKNKLEIASKDFLYLESAGNYVEIYVLKGETPKKDLLRSTLKGIQNQLKDFKNLKRCHRSFIVNLNKVETAEGNAQGLKLKLQNSENIVPVSRTYYEEIKQALAPII